MNSWSVNILFILQHIYARQGKLQCVHHEHKLKKYNIYYLTRAKDTLNNY